MAQVGDKYDQSRFWRNYFAFPVSETTSFPDANTELARTMLARQVQKIPFRRYLKPPQGLSGEDFAGWLMAAPLLTVVHRLFAESFGASGGLSLRVFVYAQVLVAVSFPIYIAFLRQSDYNAEITAIWRASDAWVALTYLDTMGPTTRQMADISGAYNQRMVDRMLHESEEDRRRSAERPLTAPLPDEPPEFPEDWEP